MKKLLSLESPSTLRSLPSMMESSGPERAYTTRILKKRVQKRYCKNTTKRLTIEKIGRVREGLW